MKSLRILILLLSAAFNAEAYSIQGKIAEDKLLLLVDRNAEIWLRWDYPNSKDSDRYFKIENCEFPPDIVTLNEMMRNWWDFKVPGGLAKLLSKDQFLAFRRKVKTESSDYLKSVYCY